MLALGLVAIYRSGCGLAIFTTVPSILLATTMAIVGWRALTSFGTYGVDSVRDGMIILYGFYAFIVIALVLQKPERISRALKAFGSFAWLYAIIGGSLAYLSSTLIDFVPNWPLLGVPMLHTRQGESAVHLTGAAVFALLGLRKFKTPWVIMLFFSIILVTPSRGAMLSCFIPIGLALVLSGQLRKLAPVFLCAAVFLSFTYVADIKIPLPGGRSIGSEQLVENVTSIVAKSDTSNLDGTKEWRLRWWNAIEDYTFNGPYFWSGKGFGMGLAEEDGFVVGRELGGPMLRSPHNAHYTMLARAGVPGLLLWVTLNLAWYAMIFGQWYVARRNGHDPMGQRLSLDRLLRAVRHHRRDVRRSTRGADAGHLVLVAVRLRHWRGDDLSLPAARGKDRRASRCAGTVRSRSTAIDRDNARPRGGTQVSSA